MTTAELVHRAQAGDTDAFAAIYTEHLGTVHRFVYARVRSRELAEDITSETFAKALARLDSWQWRGTSIAAWLQTIARNLVFDYFKSSRNRREVLGGDALTVDRADDGRGPEQTALDAIQHEQLRLAMAQLTDEQRECLSLRYLREMSIAETAAIMGRNDSAIKALTYRATRTLTRFLLRMVAW